MSLTASVRRSSVAARCSRLHPHTHLRSRPVLRFTGSLEAGSQRYANRVLLGTPTRKAFSGAVAVLGVVLLAPELWDVAAACCRCRPELWDFALGTLPTSSGMLPGIYE